MNCSCGAELPDEAVFCKKCGRQVRCLSCKRELSPGAKFCGKCGAPLAQIANDGQDKHDQGDVVDKPPVVTHDDAEKKTYDGNKKNKAVIIATVCFVAVVIVGLLLSGLFSKKNITGVWRLNSGGFSYAYSSYDTCAIEFRENGEYIVYTGEHYNDDYNRGSYTYDNKQITLIVEGSFHFTYNYSLDNNQLSMVSSSGTAYLSRINTNNDPLPFDESGLAQQYINEGYEINGLYLSSQDRTSRVYQYTISKSHKYAEEQQQIEERYLYSNIGEHWYLDSINTIGTSNNWNINGVWKTQEGTTLIISSFSDEYVTYDYTQESVFGNDFHYSGTVEVFKLNIGDGYGFYIDYQPNVLLNTIAEVYFDKDIYIPIIGTFHLEQPF